MEYTPTGSSEPAWARSGNRWVQTVRCHGTDFGQLVIKSRSQKMESTSPPIFGKEKRPGPRGGGSSRRRGWSGSRPFGKGAEGRRSEGKGSNSTEDFRPEPGHTVTPPKRGTGVFIWWVDAYWSKWMELKPNPDCNLDGYKIFVR